MVRDDVREGGRRRREGEGHNHDSASEGVGIWGQRVERRGRQEETVWLA